MNLNKTFTKTLLLLTLLTLAIGLTTAQQITFENWDETEYFTEEDDFKSLEPELIFDLDIEDVEDETYVQFSYDTDGESVDINNTLESYILENDEFDFAEEFDWEADEDNVGQYDLSVSVEGEETNSTTFYYGKDLPDIDEESVEVNRHPQGNISVEWSLNEDESDANYADYNEIEFRLFVIDDEEDSVEVDSGGPSLSDGSDKLTDQNINNTMEEITYELKVEGLSDHSYTIENNDLDEESDTIEDVQPVDGVAPDFVSTSVGDSSDLGFEEYINDDSPTVEVEVEDVLSGVSYANLTFLDNESIFDDFEIEDQEDGDENVELELDLDNLDDGTYDLELYVEDNAENYQDSSMNNESFEWSFVVDTETPEPDVNLIPDPSEEEFITARTSFLVEVDDADGATTAECFVNDVHHGNDFGSSSLSGGEFNCGSLDPSDYTEGENSIYVRFEDEAGNEYTEDLGSFIFDTEPPEIESFDISPEYTNIEPDVNVEAEDSGSEVSNAEYMFSEDVDEGDGRSIDFETDGQNVEFSFQPDLSEESDGEYELYVRVEDESGKWSTLEGGNFTLDREATPNPVIETESFEIESESRTTADIEVSNEGEVPLVDAVLSFEEMSGESSEFRVDGQSSDTITFVVETNKTFGEYTESLNLESRLTNESKMIDVSVRASEEEIEEVNESLSDLEQRLDELEDNITYLEEEGASEEIIEDLRTEYQQLQSEYEVANQGVEEGEYYSIEEEFSTLGEEIEDVMTVRDESFEEYRSQQRMFYLQLFGLLIVAGAGVGGFYFYRSEYEVDLSELNYDITQLETGEFDLGQIEEAVDSVRTAGNEWIEDFTGSESSESEGSNSSDDIEWK